MLKNTIYRVTKKPQPTAMNTTAATAGHTFGSCGKEEIKFVNKTDENVTKMKKKNN